jgi:type II secretory pathway component PulJ
MAFLPIKSNKVDGFLLMEALLAILLITNFSLIIGAYFHHIHNQYAKTKKRLYALSIAHNYIDKIIHKTINLHNFPQTDGAFTINMSQKLLTENARLTIVAVSWCNDAVQLKTITAEGA